MKVPVSWLKEYVDFEDTIEGLADKLTFSGLEVEAIETIGSDFEGVVVGEVTNIEPHPGADKLRMCTVEFGEAETMRVVCGAPNVEVGGKYPFAPVGTTLPDVYPSLQTGVYDGVILFPSVGWSHKLFEPAPYYTIMGFGSKTFHGLTINNDTWEKLPADVQKAMADAATETEVFTGPWVDELEATNLGRMVMGGAIVRRVSPEARLTPGY